MNTTELRLMQLEEDNRALKIQLEQAKANIEERKIAESQLIAEDKRYQYLSDNMPDGVMFRVRINPDNRTVKLVYMSGTWEAITGIPADTALNDIQTVFNHFHPDDLPMVLNRIQENNMTKFGVGVNTMLRIFCFVDHTSRNNRVEKSQNDAQLILSIFRQPLHVSGVSRPIIRSYNRMYTTIGT
jgi:PAS domain-containing protein